MENVQAENAERQLQPVSAIAAWSSGLDAETLANLAHELRTPIQVITGLVEILRDECSEELAAGMKHILERLNVNVFDLAHTLDNLMTYALLQAGRVQTIDEDLTVQGIIAELTPSLEAANAGKGLELKFELDQAPALIRAPRRVARAIILNLMLNAIKFTDSGSVTLAIRQTRNGGMVEFEVSDTGSGLPPDLLDEVSQPFLQLSHSSARSHRGLGLGLAIVRRTVAQLNGELQLRSNAAHGASFVVRFPARTARAFEAAATRPTRRTATPPPAITYPAHSQVRR